LRQQHSATSRKALPFEILNLEFRISDQKKVQFSSAFLRFFNLQTGDGQTEHYTAQPRVSQPDIDALAAVLYCSLEIAGFDGQAPTLRSSSG
jgi:hypothetical protein